MKVHVLMMVLFGSFESIAFCSPLVCDQNRDTSKRTAVIYTDPAHLQRVDFIDSVCTVYDGILDRMPIPEFVRVEGKYLGEGIEEYDSINQLVIYRGYKEKTGPDVSGGVAREIYFNRTLRDYGRVKYSNVKSGQNVMLVYTMLYSTNLSISYYLNGKLIKTSTYDYYNPIVVNGSYYQNRIDCYYRKNKLIYATLTGTEKKTEIYSIDRYSTRVIVGTTIYGTITKKAPRAFYKKRLICKSYKDWVKQN